MTVCGDYSAMLPCFLGRRWVRLVASISRAAARVLRTWADRPAVAVALLESQLGSLPQEAVQGSLTGWNRLLVGQSALLSAGQNAVEDYLQGQQEQPQDQTDSSEPSTEPERILYQSPSSASTVSRISAAQWL